MKTTALKWLLVTAASLCLQVQECLAAHIIRFQSGDTLVAEPCGQEGGQLCFQSESGTIWIPTESVVSVEEMILPDPAAVLREVPPEALPGEGQDSVKNKAETEEERRARLYRQYKEEKETILQQKQVLHKRMKEDAYAGRASSAVNAQWEIRALNDKLGQLEDRVKLLLKGSLPDDWYDPERSRVDPRLLKTPATRMREETKQEVGKNGAEQAPPPSKMSEREREKNIRDLKETLKASANEYSKKGNQGAALRIEDMTKEIEALEAARKR